MQTMLRLFLSAVRNAEQSEEFVSELFVKLVEKIDTLMAVRLINGCLRWPNLFRDHLRGNTDTSVCWMRPIISEVKSMSLLISPP